MKKLATILTLALITACPLAGRAADSIEADRAYLPIDKVLDLKAIPPQVNVTLPRFLLKDAIAGLTNIPNKALPAGIDLADLVKDVKLIRVVVLEVAKTNRPAVEKGLKALRSELDSKWTSIVSVPADGHDSVGVYAMGDKDGESVAGVAVLVDNASDVVIVNIVGHVSIGKLLAIAVQSKKLPPELLKQLQGVGAQTIMSESGKKADAGKSANQPAAAPADKP